MEPVVQSYRFGPHRVDVVEHPDDGGRVFQVVADGTVTTETALGATPTLKDCVRVHTRWRPRTETR